MPLGTGVARVNHGGKMRVPPLTSQQMPLARVSRNCIMRRRKTIIVVWAQSTGFRPFNSVSDALSLFVINH